MGPQYLHGRLPRQSFVYSHSLLIDSYPSGTTSDIRGAASTLLSGLSPSRLFLDLIPSRLFLVSHFESIQTIEEITENAIRELLVSTESVC